MTNIRYDWKKTFFGGRMSSLIATSKFCDSIFSSDWLHSLSEWIKINGCRAPTCIRYWEDTFWDDSGQLSKPIDEPSHTVHMPKKHLYKRTATQRENIWIEGQRVAEIARRAFVFWQEVNYYVVYILHIILSQICKFSTMRKNDAFVVKIVNIRAWRKFLWPFMAERLSTSVTLAWRQKQAKK